MENHVNFRNAIQYISHVGREVEAINSLLKDLILNLEVDWISNIDEPKVADTYDSFGYVCTQYRLIYPIRVKNKRTSTAGLYTYFLFYSPDSLHVENDLATLCIGYAPDVGESHASFIEDEDCLPKSGDLDEEYLACDGRLFSDAKAFPLSKSDAWYFFLPLFSITSVESIRDLIISPTQKLLTGDSENLIFSKDIYLKFKSEGGTYESMT